MKKILSLLLIKLLLLVSCTGSTDSTSETKNNSLLGVLCSYMQNTSVTYKTNNTTGKGNSYMSMSQWACAGTERTLVGNGLPNHEVGTFPNSGNPNTISAQAVNTKMAYAPQTNQNANEKIIGYGLNGVPFDPNTAGACDDDATIATKATKCNLATGGGWSWKLEALGNSSIFNFGTDMNHAHVQPDGTYHYHGMPVKYVEKLGGAAGKMTLVGWALDGFPMYAQYGYRSAMDTNSAIVSMTTSYSTKSTPDANRPAVSEFPMGVFQQDWEYVVGKGMLDDCNGRFGVTPEFPKGIYHYFITDTYPYLTRCLKGTVLDSKNPGGTGPGNRPPGGGPPSSK